jgi:hypothetical protein
LDVGQNEVELSAVNVQGFQGFDFVMNIVTVDSVASQIADSQFAESQIAESN